MEQFFKIRKKGSSPPLYSSGGTTPKWHEKGKRWSTLGHLKNHLGVIEGQVKRAARFGYRQFVNGTYCNYEDAEVVRFEANPIELETQDVEALLKAVQDKKAAKERKLAEDRRKRKEAVELKQLANLRAKYPEA